MAGILALMMALADPCESVSAADLHRFPFTAAQAKDYWERSSRHLTWALANREWDRHWINEARFCHDAWNALDNAHRLGGDWRSKAAHLRELKSIIGAEAFAAGWMPDYLPWTRFQILER